MPSLRQQIGTLVFDRPVFAWPLLFPRLGRWLGRSWLDFHNRGERIIPPLTGPGYDCDWQWTSDLVVSHVLPSIGAQLYETALREWPIRLASEIDDGSGIPDVSFIIGHRGEAKIPHLRATIASILGQQRVGVECLVVEQSVQSKLAAVLPGGVRLIHSPPPVADMPYARAWAFNVGARHARGRILVFHDNDILVPALYARQLTERIGDAAVAARLQRFVFYLNHADTAAVFHTGKLADRCFPDAVRQNCEGHTLAMDRESYFRLGGHDESFIGWGGEDNEMFNRCRSVACYPYGYLPFVHLHHQPQPRPADPESFQQRLRERLEIDPGRRIAELTARPFGQLTGPCS